MARDRGRFPVYPNPSAGSFDESGHSVCSVRRDHRSSRLPPHDRHPR